MRNREGLKGGPNASRHGRANKKTGADFRPASVSLFESTVEGLLVVALVRLVPCERPSFTSAKMTGPTRVERRAEFVPNLGGF